MKKIVIAILVSISMSAYAWGSREQGALAGIVAGVVISQQFEERTPHVFIQPAPVYQYPQPIYQPYPTHPTPRVIVCRDYQNYDKHGRPYGIQRVCQ